MQRLLLVVLIFYAVSSEALASCSHFHQSYLVWNLQSKRISINEIIPETRKVCAPFVDDSKANILIEFRKKNIAILQRKIFIQTNVFWDKVDGNQKLSGGVTQAEIVYFNTLIPESYQGGTLSLFDLKKKKLIGRAQL